MGISLSKVFNLETYDDPKPISDGSVYHRKMQKLREEMSGWERVQAIFETDEFGDISPEMYRCKDATLISIFLGAVVGGYGRSRIAAESFIKGNVHEVFETPQTAQKALSDRVFIGFADGAFRIAWRLGAFTFMYMIASSSIAAYRGKSGIIDQVGGAAAAGFLYKFKDGPKASVSGLVFGGILGLGAGVLTVLGAKAAGTSPDELIKFQYRNIENRKYQEYEAKKAQRLKDSSDDLISFHEHFMADDDLAMANIKKTPIGQLKEAVKNQQIDPSKMELLVPSAITNVLSTSAAQSKETVQSSVSEADDSDSEEAELETKTKEKQRLTTSSKK